MITQPNALCFGGGFPASGSPCFVLIESDGITVTFSSESAEGHQEAVSFSDVKISVGGLDHDQLVVKWTGRKGERTLYLKNDDVIRAFRERAPDYLNDPPDQAAELVRVRRRWCRTVWGLVGGCVLAVLLGLWFGAGLLVDVAVARIPVEWEQRLGEATYRDLLSQQVVLKEGLAVVAVEEITHRLVEQIPDNPYQFDITVVRNDAVNAFALPGGYIVVFTGLIKQAQNGEEVAGVLGHELNHILRRHGLKRIVKQLGLVAVASIVLGDRQGMVGLMKRFGIEVLTLKFGRGQETEADLTGLQLLRRAKIDPSGMIAFFRRLSQKDEGRLEWFSTHPMSIDRADRLKAAVAAMPEQTPEPFTFDWSKVRESLDGRAGG